MCLFTIASHVLGKALSQTTTRKRTTRTHQVREAFPASSSVFNYTIYTYMFYRVFIDCIYKGSEQSSMVNNKYLEHTHIRNPW